MTIVVAAVISVGNVTPRWRPRGAGSPLKRSWRATRAKHLPAADIDALTDEDSDRNWSANADIWDAGYDECGDDNRKYYSDPVLLAFLGDVAGRRVLDAGSGGGYLARLLTWRGARVVAVENARRFYELALAQQEREPLGIRFHHGSIALMPYLVKA